MKYKIKGYQRYTGYDKVFFSVEADSLEEALRLVKESPEVYEKSAEGADCADFEYIDKDEWEVL